MYTISLNPTRLSPEDADDLRAYLSIIPYIPLLTAAQEATADANTLVEHSMRLSAAVACKYAGRGVPVTDLIQEGNMGLMRAAQTFDASKGRFSTYAVKSVREFILRAIHNQAHTIRRPVWAQDGSKRPDIHNTTRALVEASTTVSGDKVLPQMNAALGGLGSTREQTLFDLTPDPADTELDAIHNVDCATIAPAVMRAIARLNARDRDLIDRRHFRGQGVQEIADALGYTNGSTRQLLTNARKQLRALLQSEGVHEAV